jgi:hypothetical protein
MKKSNLITQNGLELPCVIFPVEKSLFPIGKEVLVYCQNRLVRGYVQDDDDYVAEIEIVVEFAIIPELDEFLKEHESNNKEETICIDWF